MVRRYCVVCVPKLFSACFLFMSATILFFFIRWFVRIINNIIEDQRNIQKEILQLQKEQIVLPEKIRDTVGATNKGITLRTRQSQGYDKTGDGIIDRADLKLVTDRDVEQLLRTHYWDRRQADRIDSQPIANLLADWVLGGGKYGIRN